jgi:hypothetical protein
MSENKLAAIEWGNPKQIFSQFGLTRGTLYRLAQAGRIKSVSIKTKVASRKGVRLFSIASIRELLDQSLS